MYNIFNILYYIIINELEGARLYRETILPGKGRNPDRYKFEAITTTVEDLENYVNDPKEIKASARKDKALYNNLVKELIPEVKESIEVGNSILI